MIPANDMIKQFQKMYHEHWKYEWGKHEKGCVDCSGAFTYAFSLYGKSCPNGSNAMARNYIVGKLLPINKAEPGMVAFKAREPGENKYNLPAKYQKGGSAYNGDLNDYYHVGLVDEDGKHVLNAKGTSYGFCRDDLTTKNGWDYVAYLKYVDYPSSNTEGDKKMEPYQAKVVGGGLNLRSDPSKNATRILQIPDGTTVTVLEENQEWAKVEYAGCQGWVMSAYLEKTNGSANTNTNGMVQVPANELEKIYDLIGDWLGLRG